MTTLVALAGPTGTLPSDRRPARGCGLRATPVLALAVALCMLPATARAADTADYQVPP